MKPVSPRTEADIIPRLSAHSLRQLTSCPRKFALRYKVNRYWPAPEGFQAQSADLGQSFHRLVQQHRLGLDLQATLEHEKKRFPEIEALWNNYLHSQYVTPEKAWDEQELVFLLEGVPFSVRFDRVIQQGDHWLILDWKTGHADPRRLTDDWQTKLYPFALAEAGHLLAGEKIAPENIKLVYWIGKTGQELPFAYNTFRYEQDLEVFKQKAREASQPFEAFLRKPSHCPECHYRSLCDQNPQDILTITEELPRFVLDRRADADLDR